MSETLTLKCPSCGAYLVFDPAEQRFSCPFCEKSYTREEAVNRFERKVVEAVYRDDDTAHTREYHCAACGAEIVTDDTTAATFCYYCHNPVTLVDRVSASFHPDGVVPFTIDREGATARFKDFLQKKRFLRHDFFSEASLKKFSGVYYPYWLGDIEGDASYKGEGTRVSVSSSPRYDTITTQYFAVEKSGKLTYRQMMRKALNKTERKLSDGLYPYQFNKVKRFSPVYLSGFYAEKRDVERKDALADMLREAKKHTEGILTKDMKFDSLRGSASFTATKTSLRYLLLPAWVLTYRHKEKGIVYYYMMNGQTGTVCGKLPIHWGKLLGFAVLCGLVLFGLLCLGGVWLW